MEKIQLDDLLARLHEPTPPPEPRSTSKKAVAAYSAAMSEFQAAQAAHQRLLDRIRKFAAAPDTTALVLFENRLFDSSEFGKQAVLKIGPDCTYKTIDEVANGHLGDVPSRFMYPVAWVDCTTE